MADTDEFTKPVPVDEEEDAVERVAFAKDVEEKPEEIVDAEVVEAKVSTGASRALSTIEIESLIYRHLADIDKLRDQLKTQKEMYDSTVQNDAAFSEQAEKEKEVKKATAAIKQKITKQPAVVDINNRMKDIKLEIKDMQDTISKLAEQYEQISGNDQLVKEDGEVLQIVKSYRLVKKRDE